VKAADTTTSTITGSAAVTLSSYLIMREGTVAPAETFSYTVSYLGTSSTIDKPVDGNPVGGSATFSSTSVTSTTAGSAMTRTTTSTDKEYVSKGSGSDVITLNSDDLYARQDFTLDFQGVTYYDIGTYDYLITETPGTNTAITYASPMILQVSIEYTDATSKTLAAPVYVLHKAKSTTVGETTTYSIDTSDSAKYTGFTNRYETFNLNVINTVTGNQASHDEYFPVTVNLTGATAGTTYKVDLSKTGTNTEATPTNTVTSETHTNPQTITIKADGTATAEFWLKNRESVTIQGLAKGVKYSVQQDYTKMTTEGYTPTAYKSTNTIQSNLIYGVYTTTGSDSNYKYSLTFDDDGTACYERDNISAKSQDFVHVKWSQLGNVITLTTSEGEYTIKYVLSVDGKTLTFQSYSIDSTDSDDNKNTLLGYLQNQLFNQNFTSTNPTVKGSKASFSTGTYSTTAEAIAADTTILFENNNEGAIPTGVILSVAPYAAVLLAGLFGLIIFMMKRRNQEEAE